MITREERAKAFFQKAKALHQNRFNYENFIYINAKTKSIITCSDHGDFLQNPDKHLQSKYPCPECLSNQKPLMLKGRSTGKSVNRLPLDKYLEKLNLPSKFSLDTSNYISSTKGSVILTCPEHGSKIFNPRALMVNTFYCPGCGWEYTASLKRKGYEAFLEDMEKVHGNRYTPVNPEEYIDRKSILTLLCKEHGEFKKKVQKLLSGQTCQRCTIDKLIFEGKLTGGYDERLFSEKPEIASQPATIYYLKVGSTYKIGITRNNLNGRLRNIRSESKKEVTVLQTFDCSLKEAYLTEQYILNKFAQFRTIRRWSTEVFSTDVLSSLSIKDLFNEIN